jgi:CheY-like chemotaxis protein
MNQQKAKILVVDDKESNLRLMGGILSQTDTDIIYTDNGPDALE